MPVRGPKILPRGRVQTESPDVLREQTKREETTARLNQCPMLFGRLVSVHFTVGGGDQVVTHRLGVPAGWQVVRGGYSGNGFAANIAEATSQAGLDANNQIRLNAADVCKADIWFYPRASQPIDPTTGQSE